jgi:hypothetical protein
MNVKNFIYVKKQKVSRYLALKLSRNRSFTAMQLMLKTLKCNGMLPEKLIAIDLFGFVGTTTTMDYSDLAEHLELWEIDPYYAKEAQKNLPNAKVICGDSINAVKTGRVLRKDYNFIVIDANVSSAFADGSYESFGVFPNVLKYTANQAVIFVTIFSNVNEYIKLHLGGSTQQLDQNWLSARKDFFQLENVIDAKGIDYLKAFEKIINDQNHDLVYSQFISRNDCVGFGVFVVKKRNNLPVN